MSEPTKKQLQDELAEVNREWEKSQERTRVAEIRTAELLVDRDFSEPTAWCLVAVTVLVGICGVVNVIETQHSRDAVIAAIPKATIPELTKDHFPTIEHCPQGQIRHSGDTTICIHRVTVSAPVGCWLGAGATDEDTLKRYPMQSFDWWQGNDGAQLHVRSGCVGKVRYSVDGVEVHPANLSKSSKTETVRLPQ
jgi:hypothetical protein